MARVLRDPELLALQRRQLDARLREFKRFGVPKDGWIRTIRTALGMSAAQLGRRLGVSQQEATDLERRERTGSITISTLARAAAAMDCELAVVFVPKTSLDETVRRQASAKAGQDREAVVHTMRLEAREAGVSDALDLRAEPGSWLRLHLARLWD